MPYQTYHSYYLELIKKILGASFVGWQKEKGNQFLKIVINKETKLLPLPPNKTVTEETYTDLIDKLLPNENAV